MVPAPSTVAFPASESEQSVPVPLPQHLPFRRISLPTQPTLIHRESVVSVASFDSLTEESQSVLGGMPRSMPSHNSGRLAKQRPTSVESPRRRNKRRESATGNIRLPAVIDEARETKRRKVIHEFYDTEKAYVDGLELIYSHFLTPIISSLDTPEPLLDRPTLTAIFSNFIDIWNLHRALFASLTSIIFFPESQNNNNNSEPEILPSLSPILIAHFPYLSLYTPFVTSFPAALAALARYSLPNPSALSNTSSTHTNPRFSTWLKEQESDPRCGRLALRDWLLTIVQRCPRYLLLLKDLISCTDPEDRERNELQKVWELVEKITTSLNTSLQTHAITLALLALQRHTPSLPFPLVAPGRVLIRRGRLIQSGEGLGKGGREREFLLFSDCLLWLSPPGGGTSVISTASASSSHGAVSKLGVTRPSMTRSRSKSEAELPMLAKDKDNSQSQDSEQQCNIRKSNPIPVPPRMMHRHASSGWTGVTSAMTTTTSSNSREGEESKEGWEFKGKIELVDLEVIVDLGGERGWEVLSPEGSFEVFADSSEARDEWVSAIRLAKAQQLAALHATHPHSTLVSSASTTHVRRSLQALPFMPGDDRLGTIRPSQSTQHKEPPSPPKSKLSKLSAPSSSMSMPSLSVAHSLFSLNLLHQHISGTTSPSSSQGKMARERRGKIDHWMPAVWVPDEKTGACMRCGRAFGWRRRRHHCRLCGRCVCAGCSGRTFFINDPNAKDPAMSTKPARACDACYEAVFPLLDPSDSETDADTEHPFPPSSVSHIGGGSDTVSSLANLPSWVSMPAIAVQKPQALMAIDIAGRGRREEMGSGEGAETGSGSGSGLVDGGRRRVRLKSLQRPKSYNQLLEDFQELAVHPGTFADGERGEEAGREEIMESEEDFWTTPTTSLASSPATSPIKNREDTARRVKRFSQPAVAVQATSVTAHTQSVEGEHGSHINGNNSSPGGRRKRFSLMLSGRNGGKGGRLESFSGSMLGGGGSEEEVGKGGGLGKGVAAGKLSELLARKVK